MTSDNYGAAAMLLVVLASFFLAPRAGALAPSQAVFEAPLLQGGTGQPRGVVQATLDDAELRIFAAFWLLDRPWASIDVYRGDPNAGGTSMKNLGILVPTESPYGGGIDATVTLTDDQVADLHAGLLYLVVRTYDPGYHVSGCIEAPATEAEFRESPLSHVWGGAVATRGRVRAFVTPGGLRIVGFVNHLPSDWQRVAVYRGDLGQVAEEVGSLSNFSWLPSRYDGIGYTFSLYEGWEEDFRAGRLSVEIHAARPADGLRGRLLDPSNQPPAASSITSPEDESYIVVGGESEPVDPDVYLGQVEFTRTEDPDGDPVGYLWQTSLQTDFQGATVTIDLGVEETRTRLTVEFAAALLDSLTGSTSGGVPLGTPTKVYHRVVTTDGSRYTTGPPRSVTFVRGSITSVDSPGETPDGFALHGNYPNPFNPSTTVVFDLPAAAAVTLDVYDLAGRRVWASPERTLPSGANQRIEVDGSGLASGTYLYRLTARTSAGPVVGTGRMTMLK